MPRPLPLVPVLVLILAACGAAVADEPRAAPDVERRLDALETENRALRERLDAVERREATAPTHAADPLVDPEGPSGEASSGLGLDLRYGDVRIAPKVFGDVGFSFIEPRHDELSPTFFLGELDFFVTARFGEHWQALAETVVESRATDEGEEFEIEVERLWVQYELAPWLRFKLGREHDPVTYWNRRFHHGAWVQTSLTRPRIVQFEEDDGLLPIDVTGLELNGRFDGSPGALEYVAGVYNGRGRTPDEIQSVGDRNANKALTFHLRGSPGPRPSLWVGASVYRDEIPPDPRDPARGGSIGEWIVGGFVLDRFGPVEVIGEAIWVEHRDRAASQTYETFGAYGQASVALGPITPYLRVEGADVARADPFYDPVVIDSLRGIGGVRWDAHDSIAVKLEYGFGREKSQGHDAEHVHRIAFQVAFVF
jgi:hypothetical protein